MIFEFNGLSEKEIEQIMSLKNDYPNDVVVRTVVAGFNGEEIIQLLINSSPVILELVFIIIEHIKDSRKSEKQLSPIVVVVCDNGERKEIGNLESIQEIISNERRTNKNN